MGIFDFFGWAKKKEDKTGKRLPGDFEPVDGEKEENPQEITGEDIEHAQELAEKAEKEYKEKHAGPYDLLDESDDDEEFEGADYAKKMPEKDELGDE